MKESTVRFSVRNCARLRPRWVAIMLVLCASYSCWEYFDAGNFLLALIFVYARVSIRL